LGVVGIGDVSEVADQGVTVNGTVNIVPANASAMAFGRTPGQVLNVVYLTPTTATSGGFFPNGVNGSLNSSGGSQMGTMPAGARPPAVAAPPGHRTRACSPPAARRCWPPAGSRPTPPASTPPPTRTRPS